MGRLNYEKNLTISKNWGARWANKSFASNSLWTVFWVLCWIHFYLWKKLRKDKADQTFSRYVGNSNKGVRKFEWVSKMGQKILHHYVSLPCNPKIIKGKWKVASYILLHKLYFKEFKKWRKRQDFHWFEKRLSVRRIFFIADYSYSWLFLKQIVSNWWGTAAPDLNAINKVAVD